MREHFKGILINAILLSAMLTALPSRIYAFPVESGHAVYGFLRRLEILGVIPGAFFGSLPMPKKEIVQLLDVAQVEVESNRNKLSPNDLARLRAFRREFIPEDGNSRLAYIDSTRRFIGHLEYFTGGYAQDSVPKAVAFAFGSFTPSLTGEIGPSLSFISSASIGMERSHYARFVENYDAQRGMPYNTNRDGKRGLPQKVSTLDAFRTVASLEGDGYKLEAGNDWNQWGPGHWQHHTFGPRSWFWVQDSLPAVDTADFFGTRIPGSHRRGFRYPGENSPMTQVRLGFGSRTMEYTKFIAQKTGLHTDSLSYIVAHRLEFQLGKRWRVGMHEMVSLSNRPLEMTYIIPLVPLKYAEHQLGDRDNIALGADLEYVHSGLGRLYGELFLDDLIDFSPDFWGNKVAFTLGGEVLDLLLGGTTLRAEYSRVEPWLYGHHRYNNQLQNFGSLLGSEIPPNSHILHLSWEKHLLRGLDLGWTYGFLQRQIRERGSSLFDFHNEAVDGIGKEFLGENPESRHHFAVTGAYNWRRHVELRGALGFLQVENWKQSGENMTTPTASGEVFLRY